MPRPGVVIVNRDSPPSRGFPTYTGTWFVTGLSAKGPVGVAKKVGSLQEFIRDYGDRVSYGMLYDAVDVFFREGGSSAYVSRIVGPAAVAASFNLTDGTNPVLKIAAKHPGDYGNTMKVQVIAGQTAGTFILVITEAGVEVERSPELVDKAAAVYWGTGAKTVNVTGLAGTNDPTVVAATSLAGGLDDRASVVESHWTTALGAFTRTLGPGQVSAPGRTTPEAATAVLTHCLDNNRVGLIDGPDTGVLATIQGARTALAAPASLASVGAMFVPWVQVPGVVAGTQRTVPYSAVQAGIEARRDSQFSPNRAAAGRDFPLSYVLNLNYEFNDVDRETLLNDGVNTAKVVYGLMETYGYRSLAKKDITPNWWQFNHARLRMAISANGEDIGEGFVFDEVDGRQGKLSEYAGALKGMLLGYYVQGSLFGETPDEAFHVEVGPTVNTAVSIANGEMRAVAAVRMSPHAELIYIEFVKVPITENL